MSQVVCVERRPAHHVCEVFQDPATAIVEVAVHKTCEVLDTVPQCPDMRRPAVDPSLRVNPERRIEV